jgi:phospholipase D-like protein
MRFCRDILVWLCLTALGCAAHADSYTGETWGVYFNLPDQTTSWETIGTDEYLIRDVLLARIDALGSGDWACLATYSFSAGNEAVGAAGPILAAVSNALGRGAKMGFVVDYDVDITSNYWPGISLSSLENRAVNPLELSQSPDGGIQHSKVGVFWFNATQTAWVGAGSWNFTGGASSQQWNIWTEIQDNTLGGAYSNEMRELLSGRFHSNTNKSHAHDGTRFQIAGMTREGWVRFAPYPSSSFGGSNARTDIIRAIDVAQDEIFFGLNMLTQQAVVDALVAACNRGVVVHGVIPKSDREGEYDKYYAILNSTNYATRNRVRMYEAYYDAARTRYDNNRSDLVHAKYMVIDPRGANPLVIQGSANWTWSALVSTSYNDENVQFLPHAGIAEAFRSQFAAMTDGTLPWCNMLSDGATEPARVEYWLPDSALHELVWTDDLLDSAGWTNSVRQLPAEQGTNSLSLPRDKIQQFFRIQAVP